MTETSGCELVAFVVGIVVPSTPFDVQFRLDIARVRCGRDTAAVES